MLSLTKEITQYFDSLLEHDPPTLGPDTLLSQSIIGSIVSPELGYWVLIDRRNLRPVYGHA